MSTEWTTVRNALVLRDAVLTHRWYDAFGDSVRKWRFGPDTVTSTTTSVGSTVTSTNGTLVSADSVAGGAVTFTLGGADNDLLELQSVSEPFYFAAAWPAYYGVKFGQMVDADQTDVALGFTIRDADHSNGVTDGFFFRIVDESAVLSLVLEKNSNETTTELLTAAEATDYTLEMYYDGSYVYAYLNGVLVTSIATSNANFPNDEHLCATVSVVAGEGAANNVRVYWARAIQVQEP